VFYIGAKSLYPEQLNKTLFYHYEFEINNSYFFNLIECDIFSTEMIKILRGATVCGDNTQY